MLGDDSDEDSDEEVNQSQLSVRNPSPGSSQLADSPSRHLARARFDVKLKYGASRIIPYPPATPSHGRNTSMPEWMSFEFDSPNSLSGRTSSSSRKIVPSKSCAEDYGWDPKIQAIPPEHLRSVRRRRRHSDHHDEWIKQKMRQRAELYDRPSFRMVFFPPAATSDAGLGLGIRAPAHPNRRSSLGDS